MAEALFEERKHALEEDYFRKLNGVLVARLREARQVEDLETASGVWNEALIDQLVHHGITPATLPAFAMLPLIEVAWADGEPDDYERRAVLADAATALEPGSAAAAMVERWLVERPPGELVGLWFDFTRGVCEPLDAGARTEMELEMLARATAVAQASGATLGFGSSISPEEHRALDAIRAAYRPDGDF